MLKASTYPTVTTMKGAGMKGLARGNVDFSALRNINIKNAMMDTTTLCHFVSGRFCA